jgi:hypothetical protein
MAKKKKTLNIPVQKIGAVFAEEPKSDQDRMLWELDLRRRPGNASQYIDATA